MSQAVLDKETASSSGAVRERKENVNPQSIVHAPGALTGPAWWTDARRAAWQKFEALPYPEAKASEWRFGKVGPFVALEPYLPAEPLSASVLDSIREHSAADARALGAAGVLVFANDVVVDFTPLSAELAAQGVIFEPLAVAVEKHADLLRTHYLQQEATLGSEKFRQLHAARLTNGTFLYVPKGVRIEAPFHIFHWLGGEGRAIFPHTLVVAGELAEVTVADYYLSVDPAQSGFSAGVNDLIAASGAKIHYASSQRFGRGVVSVQVGNTQVGRDAQVKSLNLHLGGVYSRVENKSRLVGAGGRSDMLALTVSQGTEIFDQRTYQDHLAPHTTSDLLYKNALADESQTIFAGLIRVEPAGQQTNAYQSNRNLLLDAKAEAHSLPGLEIMANDVRCTHGSTTGQVEPEQIFYLAQRGIPTPVAQRLLVFGFFQEVLTRFGHEAVTTEFVRQIEAKFGKR